MISRYLFLVAFALMPLLARAAANPDFKSDAAPILARQPGLIDYIHRHFEVRETGVARIPGNREAAPQPPFIFNARPRGNSGPFYLALLIQPGPPGRILKVADIRKLPPGALPPQEGPAVAHSLTPVQSTVPASQPPTAAASNLQPAANASLSPPTDTIGSDTPSGPVKE